MGVYDDYAIKWLYSPIPGNKSVKEVDISWSERAAQDFMLESLLLYLAVAHFGRGRGDWQEGESPEFWKKAVQDAMTEQKVSFQAIRKLTPEEGVEQLTRMTDSLLRGVFMQLYERSI